MKYSRRTFLRRSGYALSAAALASQFKGLGLISALAQKNAPTDYKALVCIFMSGGNDSNNMIVPLDATGYGNYSAARNSSGLAIPSATLLPITPPSIGTQFGLHPNLSPEVAAPAAMPGLLPLWTAGKLAVVCNVGPLVYPLTRATYQNNSVQKPYQLFSHSDQTTQWQTSRSDTQTQTGWGGLTADHTLPFNNGVSFPTITSIAGTSAFATGILTRPLIIADARTSLPNVLKLEGFGTAADEVARKNAMIQLRTFDHSNPLVAATSDTVQDAVDISAAFSVDPILTTIFPNTTLGNQLKQVAKVMKLNQTSAQLSLNRQIFFCSIGGFDTHQDQLTNQGNLFTQMSQAMKAFYDATVELGIDNRVTTFTLSDFGRTLQPSGSGTGVGSDHGWGNHQFVMGGAVHGTEFYGVPLAAAAGGNGTVFPTLVEGGAYDTDNRGRWIPTASVDQYAATLASWFGLAPADMPTVFHNLSHFASSNLGFV
ncbi:MAG TPA: DUF1501 domain-containing protein [Blastocatellia bacterium]|nr:DUF1501 domain-containing protein [Blastocatellia bacterium]